MGGDKDNLDLSDLNASLPAAAAALSAEDRAGLVNALKDKLQSLAGHTDVLETLSPNVRKRVEYLREIQSAGKPKLPSKTDMKGGADQPAECKQQ
uniref:Uncharacterized protein n=1 Tax=Leersia perrieri TaxID=77586 RepID=A0A0D9WLX4_9ORYZ